MLKLMNSAMMPQPGNYSLVRLTAGEFRASLLAAGGDWESYIGYPQTAEHIRELTAVTVPVSREQTRLEDGDTMLICKLAYRVANPATKGAPVADEFEYFFARYSNEID